MIEKNNIFYKIKKNKKKKLKLFNIILNNNKFNNFNFVNYNNIDNTSNPNEKISIKLLNIINDDKILVNCKYNLYGIYQNNTKLWIWATSLQNSNIDIINNIKKIKSYYYLFEYNNLKYTNKNLFYYQFLTQDVILINDKKMLKWINELILYLSNDIYYINFLDSKNNLQFLTVNKIIEKFI